jgi:uncharacterized protein (TIGR02996 family)
MTSEAAFLEAIAATPEDRTLRLVYADWLEDHDDPRAELIRVEEEMHSLPVWPDRYWEMKPRRNQLRQQVPTPWRETLGYGTDYEPMFGTIPDGWRERWRLIRELHERWWGTALGDVGRVVPEFTAAEAQLGRPLPPSLREWLSWFQDMWRLPQRFRHLPEDHPFDLYLHWLHDQQTFAVFFDDWRNFLWGIGIEELDLEDPPLQAYSSARPKGRVYRAFPRITERILEVTLLSLPSVGSFNLEEEEEPDLASRFAKAFPCATVCGELLILERPNLLASLHRSYNSLRVDVWKPIPVDAIPPFLWECAGKTWRHYGLFKQAGSESGE